MVKVKEDTHKKLTSVLGELTTRNGEIKTYDDVLKELLAAYNGRGKSEPSVGRDCPREGTSLARSTLKALVWALIINVLFGSASIAVYCS
jgi:hypothetical protein